MAVFNVKEKNAGQVLIGGYLDKATFGVTESGKPKLTVSLVDGDNKYYILFVDTEKDGRKEPGATNAKKVLCPEGKDYKGVPLCIKAFKSERTDENGNTRVTYFGASKNAISFRGRKITYKKDGKEVYYYFGSASVNANNDGHRIGIPYGVYVNGENATQWVNGNITEAQYADLQKKDGSGCPLVIAAIRDNGTEYIKLGAKPAATTSTQSAQPASAPAAPAPAAEPVATTTDTQPAPEPAPADTSVVDAEEGGYLIEDAADDLLEEEIAFD